MSYLVSKPMGWTNESIKLSCVDNLCLKSLWKMVILDSNNNTNGTNKNSSVAANTENLPKIYQQYKDTMPTNNMSLLKFLAINALELSAPASPVLLQQNNATTNGWLQLAGHPESIAPADNGIVRKRIASTTDHEAMSYHKIIKDPHASKLTPHFYGINTINNHTYLELQNLLHDFDDPTVIDIKMGRRTFLESEVNNKSLRADLYNKMNAINSSALSEAEHKAKGITKLRYMQFREQTSSSESKGFRIEALKMSGSPPVTDLQRVKTNNDVEATIAYFLNNQKWVTKELIKRLKTMKGLIEKSEFFQTHEIVGSSVFIVYDKNQCGAWLIDFAKARPLPANVKVDHRRSWAPGNCEEGLLHGMDQLISVFEKTYAQQTKYNFKQCRLR